MSEPSNSARPELDAELEAALLRELMRSWHELNHGYFKGAMRAPVLRLGEGAEQGQTLGRWRLDHRTIELSRALVVEQAWGATLEVLKHEMAHQYVHEVLGATDETAHGPAFQQICGRLGIDAAASGMPDVDDPRRARLRQRVEDLLALANSPNQNEAENAAALAQRLILKHNIALTELPERRRYGYRHLGQPKGRHAEAEHILAAILAEHFFVEAIWVPSYRPREGKRGSVLEICGTPENLEMAAYVHDFLLQTAERLWRRHKREHDIRRDRDRRRFIAGVMEGFFERLASEKRKNTEKGLVWVGDADLHRYHRRRHPHVRSVRLQGHGLDPTRARGRQAGRNIVLRRGVGEGEATSRGRALPAGRGKGQGFGVPGSRFEVPGSRFSRTRTRPRPRTRTRTRTRTWKICRSSSTSARARYTKIVTRSSRLRSQLGLRLTTSALGAPLVLVGSLLGCTTQAPPPSTPQARTPTPGTVTRNNPAGDAESPVDAALTRLIEEPIGEKADRFRTYRPLFPDANNWKRVRFWGYPSRAGFRYGKDNYAVSVLIYEEADNDDPNACLTAFAKRALNTARLFDVKLGDIERLERPHLRGIEAVDMDALIADELRVFEQRQARRKQGRERLVAMLERGKRAEAARKKAEETREAAKADESAVETEKQKAKPPTRRRRFGLSWLRDRLRHHDVQTEAMEKRKDDKHPVDHATTARAIKARGLSTMPVLLTSGGFETLSNRDKYLAAIVAHPSWPGSCLVQGIAVKVGTDEALAKKALDRWLEKAAPKSRWRWELREQPTYDTR